MCNTQRARSTAFAPDLGNVVSAIREWLGLTHEPNQQSSGLTADQCPHAEPVDVTCLVPNGRSAFYSTAQLHESTVHLGGMSVSRTTDGCCSLCGLLGWRWAGDVGMTRVCLGT